MVHSVLSSKKKHHHSAVVVFRNLFDEFLKLRYNFYAEITNGDFVKKPADNMKIGLGV